MICMWEQWLCHCMLLLFYVFTLGSFVLQPSRPLEQEVNELNWFSLVASNASMSSWLFGTGIFPGSSANSYQSIYSDHSSWNAIFSPPKINFAVLFDFFISFIIPPSLLGSFSDLGVQRKPSQLTGFWWVLWILDQESFCFLYFVSMLFGFLCVRACVGPCTYIFVSNVSIYQKSMICYLYKSRRLLFQSTPLVSPSFSSPCEMSNFSITSPSSVSWCSRRSLSHNFHSPPVFPPLLGFFFFYSEIPRRSH